MDKGARSWSPMIGYSTLGFAMTIALYDLSRHAWRDLWLARAWKLDHGLKLTGAYPAMAASHSEEQPWCTGSAQSDRLTRSGS